MPPRRAQYLSGQVSIYPTKTALDFLAQPSPALSEAGQDVRALVRTPHAPVEQAQASLPGMEMVHLIGGYEWDKDSHEIVRPVMSLRDGADNIIWLVEVSEDGSRSNVIGMPHSDGPSSPVVGVLPKPEAGSTAEARP